MSKKLKNPRFNTPKASKGPKPNFKASGAKYKANYGPGSSQKLDGRGPMGRPPVQNKVKKEETADLEQQFVLRLPPGPAMALRHDVQTGAQNLKDKLSIELPHDRRKGYVRFGGDVYNAKLVDLPCIVESWKTLDDKTLYKTADICQMLTCSFIASDSDDEMDTADKRKQREKKYIFNHGLTPPLKNVRKKRFRRTTKKKVHQEAPDIEREVKRLLRADSDAIDIKWEVVYETDTEHETTGASGQIGETELFGAAISSDEDDDDAAENDMDDFESSRLSTIGEQSQDGSDVMPDLDARVLTIQKELTNLKTEKESKRRLLSISVGDEKQKISDEIAKIEQAESEKIKECEILDSMR